MSDDKKIKPHQRKDKVNIDTESTSEYKARVNKRIQERKDSLQEGRKYVKDYQGKWSLKPSYVSSEVGKVKGPDKDARRKELQAEAKKFALRRKANR